MNLPQIDASALPNLEVLTGVFGSAAHKATMVAGDDIVVIITFLYDVLNP